jgi:hypothetical protein
MRSAGIETVVQSFANVLGEARAASRMGEHTVAYEKLWSVHNFVRSLEDETMMLGSGAGRELETLCIELSRVEQEIIQAVGGAAGVRWATERIRDLTGRGADGGQMEWWTYTGQLPTTLTREVAIWMAGTGRGVGMETLRSGWWRVGLGVRVEIVLHGVGWMREYLCEVGTLARISPGIVEPDQRVVGYMLELWERGGLYRDLVQAHGAARRIAGAARW